MEQPQAKPRPVNIRKGLPRGDPAKGGADRRAAANVRAVELVPVIAELRAEGHTSVRKLAAALEARGVATERGGRWYPTGVQRLLERIKALP